mgnify:CR=1 FL=1
MTLSAAKAGGFSGNQATARINPRTVCPTVTLVGRLTSTVQDVDSGVVIPVEAAPTFALVPADVQALLDHLTATGTLLRRATRIDRYDLPPGLRRFFMEEGEALGPPCI